MLPTLTGRITVQDRRLRSKGSKTWRREAFYILPTSNWITDTNDPVIKAALRDHSPRARINPPRIGYKTQYMIVVGLLVALIAAPLIPLARRGRRPNPSNRQ